MEKKQLTQKEELKQQFIDRLQLDCSVSPDEASDSQIYQVLSAMMVQRLKHMRQHFVNKTNSIGGKKVYYLSMEFLMGRALGNNLINLQAYKAVKEALDELGLDLNVVEDMEPDAALGNGGLGRLAACYLDAMATQGIPATGHSICYEYGIFRQELQDGWQTEFPDNWLPGGSVWLDPKPDEAIEVHFEGEIQEYWQDSYHYLSHHNYNTVLAIPYDLYVSGYGSEGVSALRLWQAKAPSFDMKSFNEGNYASALSQNSMANAISKVLYPNDNHLEGKSLRLRQQYFLSAAAIGDIVNHHMSVYGTLDNLHEKVAIHINDTHPTLAIPELMRVLLDDCGYTWDHAWHIVTNTFAYTNHTVMAEALEKWDVNLVKQIIPRIFQIIVEINNRYCASLMERNGGDSAKTTRMSIIKDNQIHMATLCVMASHSVNGVSKLHSEIIKESVFHDEYLDTPNKFKNVTNGIAYRRWLYQSNPGLTKLLREKIGNKFLVDGSELKKLDVFENDKAVLEQLRKNGIHNILALRGDRSETATPNGRFSHANELISYIHNYDPSFHLMAACYPEGHPDSTNKKEDIKNLKKKVDAGCEFLTTQMFFDNNIFYNFLYKAREAGILVPVIPGIMPITRANQVENAVRLSGCNVPERFRSIVDCFGENPAAMQQAGIAYATDQIIDLIANGIRHIHVYSMNKPEVAKGILDNLSDIVRQI